MEGKSRCRVFVFVLACLMIVLIHPQIWACCGVAELYWTAGPTGTPPPPPPPPGTTGGPPPPCTGTGTTFITNIASGNLYEPRPVVSIPGRGGGLDFTLSYNSIDAENEGTCGYGWTHSYNYKLDPAPAVIEAQLYVNPSYTPISWQVSIAPANDPENIIKKISGAGTTINATWDGLTDDGLAPGGEYLYTVTATAISMGGMTTVSAGDSFTVSSYVAEKNGSGTQKYFERRADGSFRAPYGEHVRPLPEPGWTHESYSTGIPDGWNLSNARFHSEGTSWHTGPEVVTEWWGGDTALISPEIDLSEAAGTELTFWTWYHFDYYAWGPYLDYMDGGVVEVTEDGGETWQRITPEGGYDGTISGWGDNPLYGQQAFAGESEGWQKKTFSLAAFAGEKIKIRFRVGWDAFSWWWPGTEGWYVDDIQVDTVFSDDVESGDLSYTALRQKDGGNRSFDTFGKLRVVEDRYGSKTTFLYTEDKLTGITDAGGRTITLTYNEADRISEITDPAGRKTVLTYDEQGDLVEVKDPLEGTWQYEYGAPHKMLALTDPNGHREWVVYEGDKIAAMVDPLGNATGLSYDELTRTTTITDPLGDETKKTYSTAGITTKIVDALGGVTESEYDIDYNLLSSKSPQSHETTYEYDSIGNRTKEIDALSNDISRTYEPEFNQVLTETDARDNTTTYEYDEKGNLIKKTDALGNETLYEHNEYGELLKETNARGFSTEYSYDQHGNRISMEDDLENITTYEYNILGRRTKEMDANLHATTWQYDDLDRIVKIGGGSEAPGECPSCGQSKYNVSEEGDYTYNAVGNLITFTDLLGRVTFHEYDAADREIKVVRDYGQGKLNVTTLYDYDEAGRLIANTDPNGNVTETVYDALGRRMRSIRYLSGTMVETAFTYDANGNMLSSIDPNGNTTRYEYDEIDRRVETIDALEGKTVNTYDPAGNLKTVTDALGNTVEIFYDELNRLATIGYPLNYEEVFTYDEVGSRITATDRNGNVTTYQYDPLDRLETAEDPSGNTREYGYDSVGNRISMTDPADNVTHYEYCPKNYLQKMIDPAGGETTYEIVATGRIDSVTDAKGKVTKYVHDNLDRRIKVIDDYGDEQEGHLNIEVTYAYDAAGRLLSITDDKGNTTSYEYDSLDRLVRETFADGTAKEYQYDLGGNLVHLTDQNANIIRNIYDVLNRRIEKNITRVQDIGGTTIQKFGYDALSRMTHATDNNSPGTSDDDSVAQWDYDAFGRTTQETQKIGPKAARTAASTFDGMNRIGIVYPSGKQIELAYTPTNQIDTVSANNWQLADYGYNSRNLVETESFGNGIAMTNQHDELSRITSRVYRKNGGLSVGFSYGLDAVGNKLYEERLHDLSRSELYGYDRAYRLVDFQRGQLNEDKTGIVSPVSVQSWELDALANWLKVMKPVALSDNFDRGKPVQHDLGNVWTEEGSKDSRTRGNKLEARRSNRGALGEPALVVFNPSRTSEIISAHVTMVLDEPDVLNPFDDPHQPSGGFIFGYVDENSYFYAGAKVYREAGKGKAGKGAEQTSWVIGRLDGGDFITLAEQEAPIASGKAIDLRLAVEGPKVSLYADNDLVVSGEGDFPKTGSGLISTQNMVVFDSYVYTAMGVERRWVNEMNEYTQIDSAQLVHDDNGNLVDDGTYQYHYDALNRLIQILKKDAPDITVGEYAYDALNRRIRREADEDNDGTADVYLMYFYDGWRVVEERNYSDDVLARDYVYGIYIDEPITMTNSTDTYYYHTNTLYSVAAITDSTGVIVEQYRYAAYGKPTILDGQGQQIAASAIGNVYFFTGRRFDPETELHYYRFRYYSSELGRFVTRDPRGYVDGLNLYQAYFVPHWLDALGTQAQPAAPPPPAATSANFVCGNITYTCTCPVISVTKHPPGITVQVGDATVLTSCQQTPIFASAAIFIPCVGVVGTQYIIVGYTYTPECGCIYEPNIPGFLPIYIQPGVITIEI